MDRNKDEPYCYGDLIIWKQLLEHQKSQPQGQKAALFICDDRKEDWWLRQEDARLGPRPELVREFIDAVGEDFFMYTPADFLRESQRFLHLPVSQATIEDVQRVSQFSPVESVLRAQRMVVPDPATRNKALTRIYEGISSGKLRVAGDLGPAIESMGSPFVSSYVATPLFFSLVNETYGTVRATHDAGLPLRDRSIHLAAAAEGKAAFLRLSHAAWLAQALFRVRNEGFSDDELLKAFVGAAPSPEDRELLALAKSCVESDIAYRAG
jgi:PIN like domain